MWSTLPTLRFHLGQGRNKDRVPGMHCCARSHQRAPCSAHHRRRVAGDAPPAVGLAHGRHDLHALRLLVELGQEVDGDIVAVGPAGQRASCTPPGPARARRTRRRVRAPWGCHPSTWPGARSGGTRAGRVPCGAPVPPVEQQQPRMRGELARRFLLGFRIAHDSGRRARARRQARPARCGPVRRCRDGGFSCACAAAAMHRAARQLRQGGNSASSGLHDLTTGQSSRRARPGSGATVFYRAFTRSSSRIIRASTWPWSSLLVLKMHVDVVRERGEMLESPAPWPPVPRRCTSSRSGWTTRPALSCSTFPCCGRAGARSRASDG